jgi:thioredoxin reductase (NADPH)
MEKEVITEDIRKTLKETLKVLQDEVPLEVFTQKGVNDTFNDALIALIRTLSEISPKIKPFFHGIGDAQSGKRNVTRSPTVLVAPDKYRIRFTGSPLGEEGRSLILAIVMASTRAITLTEESLSKLLTLDESREIQVFVSPT